MKILFLILIYKAILHYNIKVFCSEGFAQRVT